MVKHHQRHEPLITAASNNTMEMDLPLWGG
jgi:hypothetical protein